MNIIGARWWRLEDWAIVVGEIEINRKIIRWDMEKRSLVYCSLAMSRLGGGGRV